LNSDTIPCVAVPTQLQLHSDDVVLMAMKTQDTIAALERLRLAGLRNQAIFCVQNGVANEGYALRRFPEVHGVTVMLPATFTIPGEVSAFSTPRHGIFDIGRYPSGANRFDNDLARVLEAANIATFVTPDVMQSKYGKLLLNLGNILEAALGPDVDYKSLSALLRREGEAVLKAARIAWHEVGASDPRREDLMRQESIAGVARTGGSTTQSLARSAGSIETDYLNGEIVLLGRLFGVPVPANTYFLELSSAMLRDKAGPGTIPLARVRARLKSAGLEFRD
jgi:2-dehydropantoate 2-reductase